MLGSFKVLKSTFGTKISGWARGSETVYWRSLSISIHISSPQWAHCVLMVKVSLPLSSCPCTKGVAIASIPQAAYIFSPELNVIRCGVCSTVTG